MYMYVFKKSLPLISTQFTINKCDSTVCQIRLDYVQFDIENPVGIAIFVELYSYTQSIFGWQ